MAVPRHFRHTGPILVRASTDPGGLTLPDIDLHTGDDVESVGRPWLAELWTRPAVRTALNVASPALCAQITAALADGQLSRRQWRRLLVSVSSYLLRWRHRCTPFGLFAGVTTAAVGSTPHVKFGTDHAEQARVDPEWLDEVISKLERDPAVLAAATLIVNNAGVTRGERFAVPKDVPSREAEIDTADALAADLGAVELTVRRTRPVTSALTAARQPVRGSELIGKLRREFPAASQQQITTMLGELVTNRVLLTNLRAPATDVDSNDHLLGQLDTLDPPADIASPIRDALRTTSPHQLSTPESRVTGVVDRPPRQGVDVAVDGQVELPTSVLREAELAASLLLRLTRCPFGTTALRDYHLRFRDRYGAGALVPVRELVSDAGLGYPVGFLGSARGQPDRALTDRDAKLHRLVQEAVLDGRTEVVLSEAIIEELAVTDEEVLVPERVELAFTLDAPSTDELGRGRFQLWVSGAPPASSSMAGRFAPLLDERDRYLLADSYASDSDVMVAQLSFPPRRRHNDVVARAPRLVPWVLPIGEFHDATSPDVIDLDDLAVTATATEFFLIHMPTGRRVHAHVPHALESTVFTPPLVRFLAELATARSAVFGPVDFGAARTLPFLPRLRFGRSVLAPARWLLDGHDLPGPHASAQDWREALTAWRRRWRVPARVVLCEGEQRLPLDLDEPVQQSLLRTRLRRATTVEIRESSGPDEQGWAGRSCEFVVALTAASSEPSGTSPSVAPPGQRPGPFVRDVAIDRSSAIVPGGSSLVVAQFEGHPQRFDDILTDYLPQLHARLRAAAPRLWFRRHHDTTRPDADHYLQIFLRLTDAEQYGSAAARVAAWAEELHRVGLVARLSLETTWRQAGKYGADPAVSERVFAADSAAALAELALTRQSQLPAEAVAAVSMVDLATGLATTPSEGWQWLTTVLPHHEGPLDHDLRKHALRLAQHLAHPEHAIEDHHSGPEVTTLESWTRRREALVFYRDHLDRDPSSVLRALLHDHAIRTVAVDPEREAVTNRLARAIALRAGALTNQERT